ncbi:MAG: hypothetical protein GHCLOJNM_01010 [bacterium]|nr:hypothetical protein [bacterium]
MTSTVKPNPWIVGLMAAVLFLSAFLPSASAEEDVAAFLATLDNASAELRYPAWTTAEKYGPAVIVPLGEKMESADRSKAQDLKRAMERIVHSAARPEVKGEDRPPRQEVADELCKLLTPERSPKVKNEVLDLLGFIATPKNLPSIEPLLADQAVSEEACRAIQRIPGRAATEVFEKYLNASPDPCKPRILAALGQRKDPSAGPAIEKFLGAAKGDMKLLALGAMSKSGALPPKQLKVHLDSLGKEVSPEVKANIRLRFADNLVAYGEYKRAERIYTSLAQNKKIGEQIQIAAKNGLEALKDK